MRAMRNALIVSVTAAAVGVAAATASADTGTGSGTEPLSVALAPRVDYTASVDGNAAVITVDDAGRLAVDNGRFEIRSADGRILAGVPLEFNVDDIAFPIDAEIAGNTARLVPVLDPARAQYKPAALPFQEHAPWKTPYEREQAAFSRLAATVTMGVGAPVATAAFIQYFSTINEPMPAR
ncbi:hypothetical protein APR12_000448 [Nocardia amikacinitolerans]|nr:hypothetical protein [Nocardia amikacinitolerans]